MSSTDEAFGFKLPTLGLNKFHNLGHMASTSQAGEAERNPFKVQRDNEMLLVLRENERKFKASFKNEVEGLRVFEKTTANK